MTKQDMLVELDSLKEEFKREDLRRFTAVVKELVEQSLTNYTIGSGVETCKCPRCQHGK